MNIRIAPNYKAMSEQAAAGLLHIVSNKKNPLICVASGASPAGLYEQLIAIVRAQNVDVRSWKFVGLDEWSGMNGKDEGSCRWHLNNQLFRPLNIQEQQICFFDGKAEDKENECAKVETFIQENGGIEVAILGIGLNGHIGMNEPGTPANSISHVAEIAIQTQQIGQKYFSTPQLLSHGLTLGIATILASKEIFLLVSGSGKASIISQAVATEPTPDLPASFLRNHPQFSIYLDGEAAQLLQPNTTAMG